MSTLKRIAGGVTGQAFVRVANILQTVALVPVLIANWGLETYGGWLAVTALASYVSLSNFGLSNASGSGIVLAIGAGDQARARRVFSSSLAALVILAIPVLLIVVALAVTLPLTAWLNVTRVSASAVSLMLCMVAAQVWLETIKGLFVAVTSATGRYGLPGIVSALAKLAEIGAIALWVIRFDGGVAGAAVLMALVAAVELAVQQAVARHFAAWGRFVLRDVDRAVIRSLVKPALGNVMAQMGINAVVLQGPRVLLSAIVGPVGVAIYATHVTALRLAQQVSALYSGAVQMETMSAIGGGRFSRAAAFNALGTQLSVAVTLVAVVALAVLGAPLFELWTLGKIGFDARLFGILAVAALVVSGGYISMTTVIGANRIFAPAMVMLPLSVAGIALGAWLSGRFGIDGMAVGWLVAEAGIAAVALVAVARVLETPLRHFVAGLLNVDHVRAAVARRRR